MRPLHTFGNRIVVLGPSNAGKSTLALAIADKLDLPAIHLDQLRHLPNTDWELRPDAEFKTLHDEAVMSEKWVMDGDYSRLMPQRFDRATGVILITSNRWLRLGRYLKRSLSRSSKRAGALEGRQDSIKWSMIDWILFKTPHNSIKYSKMLENLTIPTIECYTTQELNMLYESWQLSRPAVYSLPILCAC